MHAGRMGLTVLALLLTTLAFASVEPNWYSSEKFTRATAASSYPASSAAEEAFRALRGGSIQSLNSDHRPILIHTRQKVRILTFFNRDLSICTLQSQDTVVFVRSDNTSFDIPICPPGYLDLQVGKLCCKHASVLIGDAVLLGNRAYSCQCGVCTGTGQRNVSE